MVSCAALVSLAVPLAWADVESGRLALRDGRVAEAGKALRGPARAGDAEARYLLGRVHYYGGRGVAQDYHRAARWFLAAAYQGHAAAEYKMGGMYFSGRGVGRDVVEAARWWQKAAAQGHAEAQNALGSLYAGGVGVPRDLVLAYALQEAARRAGNQLAAENLAAKLTLLTPDQFAAALSLADELAIPDHFTRALARRRADAGTL